MCWLRSWWLTTGYTPDSDSLRGNHGVCGVYGRRIELRASIGEKVHIVKRPAETSGVGVGDCQRIVRDRNLRQRKIRRIGDKGSGIGAGRRHGGQRVISKH